MVLKKLSPKHRHLIFFLFFMLLSGTTGAYYILKSEALLWHTDPGVVTGEDWVTAHEQGYGAGDTINMNVASNPPSAAMFGGTMPATIHVNLSFYHDGPVRYSGYSCPAGGCSGGSENSYNRMQGTPFDTSICVQMPGANPRSSLFQLQYIYTGEPGGTTGYDGTYRERAFVINADSSWQAGSCGQNDWDGWGTGNGVQAWGSGMPMATWGGGPQSAPSPDESPHSGAEAPGGENGGPLGMGPIGLQRGVSGGLDTGRGPGQGDNESTGSSGGGGSSANRQGNNPNSIPTASSQGNNAQTAIEPSPFYDGKQYERGTINESVSNIGKAIGVKSLRPWHLFVSAGMLGAIAGLGVWWYRHKQHQPL